jgi:hypothetical protein
VPPTPTRLSNTPVGSTPHPGASGEDQSAAYPRHRDPKRLLSHSGYEVQRPAGVDAIPGYGAKGAGRSHQPNIGHVIYEMTVENSWSCRRTVPPDGMTYQKAGAISFAVAQCTRSLGDKRLTTAR